MSNQEKKEYLELYLIQQSRIERLREQITSNPACTLRYSRQIHKAEKLRQRIEKSVDAVDGGILSEVLSQRYICGKTLEETAMALNYSKRHIERLHASAIEKFKIN